MTLIDPVEDNQLLTADPKEKMMLELLGDQLSRNCPVAFTEFGLAIYLCPVITNLKGDELLEALKDAVGFGEPNDATKGMDEWLAQEHPDDTYTLEWIDDPLTHEGAQYAMRMSTKLKAMEKADAE